MHTYENTLNTTFEIVVYYENKSTTPLRQPVAYDPIIVLIDDHKSAELQLYRVYTKQNGLATLNVSRYKKPGECYDFTFVSCPFVSGCGFYACLNATGLPIPKKYIGANLSDIPYHPDPPYYQPANPLAGNEFLPAIDHVKICPPPTTGTTLPAFCLPLFLILGMLMGALYYSGKNPLGSFDLSAPRLGSHLRYQARARSMASFDTMSLAQAAKGAGSEISGIAKGEKSVLGLGGKESSSGATTKMGAKDEVSSQGIVGMIRMIASGKLKSDIKSSVKSVGQTYKGAFSGGGWKGAGFATPRGKMANRALGEIKGGKGLSKQTIASLRSHGISPDIKSIRSATDGFSTVLSQILIGGSWSASNIINTLKSTIQGNASILGIAFFVFNRTMLGSIGAHTALLSLALDAAQYAAGQTFTQAQNRMETRATNGIALKDSLGKDIVVTVPRDGVDPKFYDKDGKELSDSDKKKLMGDHTFATGLTVLLTDAVRDYAIICDPKNIANVEGALGRLLQAHGLISAEQLKAEDSELEFALKKLQKLFEGQFEIHDPKLAARLNELQKLNEASKNPDPKLESAIKELQKLSEGQLEIKNPKLAAMLNELQKIFEASKTPDPKLESAIKELQKRNAASRIVFTVEDKTGSRQVVSFSIKEAEDIIAGGSILHPEISVQMLEKELTATKESLIVDMGKLGIGIDQSKSMPLSEVVQHYTAAIESARVSLRDETNPAFATQQFIKLNPNSFDKRGMFTNEALEKFGRIDPALVSVAMMYNTIKYAEMAQGTLIPVTTDLSRKADLLQTLQSRIEVLADKVADAAPGSKGLDVDRKELADLKEKLVKNSSELSLTSLNMLSAVTVMDSAINSLQKHATLAGELGGVKSAGDPSSEGYGQGAMFVARTVKPLDVALNVISANQYDVNSDKTHFDQHVEDVAAKTGVSKEVVYAKEVASLNSNAIGFNEDARQALAGLKYASLGGDFQKLVAVKTMEYHPDTFAKSFSPVSSNQGDYLNPNSTVYVSILDKDSGANKVCSMSYGTYMDLRHDGKEDFLDMPHTVRVSLENVKSMSSPEQPVQSVREYTAAGFIKAVSSKSELDALQPVFVKWEDPSGAQVTTPITYGDYYRIIKSDSNPFGASHKIAIDADYAEKQGISGGKQSEYSPQGQFVLTNSFVPHFSSVKTQSYEDVYKTAAENAGTPQAVREYTAAAFSRKISSTMDPSQSVFVKWEDQSGTHFTQTTYEDYSKTVQSKSNKFGDSHKVAIDVDYAKEKRLTGGISESYPRPAEDHNEVREWLQSETPASQQYHRVADARSTQSETILGVLESVESVRDTSAAIRHNADNMAPLQVTSADETIIKRAQAAADKADAIVKNAFDQVNRISVYGGDLNRDYTDLRPAVTSLFVTEQELSKHFNTLQKRYGMSFDQRTSEREDSQYHKSTNDLNSSLKAADEQGKRLREQNEANKIKDAEQERQAKTQDEWFKAQEEYDQEKARKRKDNEELTQRLNKRQQELERSGEIYVEKDPEEYAKKQAKKRKSRKEDSG